MVQLLSVLPSYRAQIKRYTLVFLFLILGGGGIFSEESPGRHLERLTVYSVSQPLLVRLKQKDFVVFCPVEYTFSNKKTVHQRPPESGIKISSTISIMGKGSLKAEEMAAFLHRNNPTISLSQAKKIAKTYMEEANAEGVNYDVAFSQMCLETGFLRYGGTVLPGQNNFCGLGVLNKRTKGFSFHNLRMGIRAHIQHLKAYASNGKLRYTVVDPRFRFVKRGSITDVNGLSGRWATDKHYGKKIRYLLHRMYREKV
jgi:hypothetical protein